MYGKKFKEVQGLVSYLSNFFHSFNFSKLNFISINNNSRAIGPVVATALLLVVSVSSVLLFQNWFQTFQSDLLSDIENRASIDSVDILRLESDLLYIRNTNYFNLTTTELRIGNNICTSAENISIPSGIISLDLDNCLSGLNKGVYKVVLITKNGVFSSSKYLNSIYAGDFSVSFQSGPCSIGYVRLFGLESFTNSHAELSTSSNYTYNICLKHNSYTLSSSCIGNYERLFYLDGTSNSHAYIINTSIYENDWHEVCVNSNSGVISTQINSTNPNDGSVCIGSFEEINNVNGAHLGNCESYSNDIWLKIE